MKTRMKTRTLVLSGLTASLALIGCSKFKSAPAPSPTPTAAAAATTVAATPPPTPAPTPVEADAFPKEKATPVKVTAKAFAPGSVKAHANKAVAIAFTRSDDKTCPKVEFPDLNITVDLPVKKAVRVSFKPEKAGEVAFDCAGGP